MLPEKVAEADADVDLLKTAIIIDGGISSQIIISKCSV